MTRCYRPWSKFNAHQWSNLNERGHLISKRVYKPPFAHDESIRIMLPERGEHSDPDILDALVAVADKFEAIAHRYKDATD